ncbi:hypothetical protein, partial [Actinocorallia libanotica]|uniref:hypothetical protein n=1 Tax=Actinocorallia libanotica TaxID=46162 RepID=UPI0031DDA6CD
MDEGEASPQPCIDPEEPHPAVAVFIRRLQLAYETACSPGPMRLKEISQELTGKRRWIAKSTFYDNLSGERRTEPLSSSGGLSGSVVLQDGDGFDEV